MKHFINLKDIPASDLRKIIEDASAIIPYINQQNAPIRFTDLRRIMSLIKNEEMINIVAIQPIISSKFIF